MIEFKKYVDGMLCIATPIYKGLYDDKIFKMCFNEQSWFDAELRNINLLSSKYYAPNILNIDSSNKEITLDWKDACNLNHAFHKANNIPNDWLEQVKSIISDLEKSKVYKLNLYPHTFYVVNDKIHLMDLHACVLHNDTILEQDISSVINDRQRFKFVNGILDIQHTYNYTIKNNVGNWPEEFLNA